MKRGRNVFWGYVIAAALFGVIVTSVSCEMKAPMGPPPRPASSERSGPPTLETPHSETIQTPYSKTVHVPYSEPIEEKPPPPPIDKRLMERPKATYRTPMHRPSQVPSTALADHFRIDEILASLEWGNIAFNTPQSMNLGDTTSIQLVLGLDTEIDDLKKEIEATGEKEGARIRVSDRMEAHLSGLKFTIIPNVPEELAVSKSEFTKWEWEVKPQAQGRQKLHLTLSVLIVIDGTSTRRTIRTFERDIEVEVTRRQWIAAFLEKNWQWLWTAALVPIAGWLWSRRKGKGNETRSDQPQGQSSQETRGGTPGDNG